VRCYTFRVSDPSSVPIDLPDHAGAEAQAAQLALGMDVAELHGTLCGLLAGGGHPRREDWLSTLVPGATVAAPERDSLLDRLFQASGLQLGSSEMILELLLPEDEAPLARRAEALLSWCRGFLAGFGLSGMSEPQLGEESLEALRDLGHIASSTLDYEDPEQDDAALAEITEYVRIVAQLLFEECARPRRPRRLH